MTAGIVSGGLPLGRAWRDPNKAVARRPRVSWSLFLPRWLSFREDRKVKQNRRIHETPMN